MKSRFSMASVFLRPVLRPQLLGLGFGLSITTLHLYHRRSARLDTGPSPSPRAYNPDIQLSPHLGVGLQPKTVRQISSGSTLGLCAGVAMSTFSRSIALLIGLLIIGIQWAASYGIELLPYSRLQRYFANLNLKSAVKENVAFKLSFGLTFTAAAFMHF